MNQGESQQATEVRRQLARLVATHGADLLDDGRRVRAMLGDAVAGATAEANLIGLAVSSGVPAKLRQGASMSATAQELQRTSSVQPQDAEWAVGAIAEALGIQPSAPAVPSAPTPSLPQTVDGRSAGGASGSVTGDDLVVKGAGINVVVAAGTVATIGRDPGSTVILTSTAVSRQHARIARGASGWEYTDVGSAQGSFSDGSQVRTKLLTQPAEITLGQGADSVRLQFLPGGVAASPESERRRPDVKVGASPTVVPGGKLGGRAPATVVTGAESLTVTMAGTSRVVTAGGSLTVGREDDNDLVATASTVSRHHLRVEQVGGGWKLKDLGSSSGTWLNGQRVTEVSLVGTQEFVLGDQNQGDRLTTQAPGGTKSSTGPLAGVLKSGARPAWLLPAIAAGVVLLIVVGLIGWKTLGGSSNGNAPLTRDQLAQATVFINVPSTDTSPGWSGSGVIVDKAKGLIMTNAHVAVPAAAGQAIPPPWDENWPPTMSNELSPNPKQLEISVTKGLTSAAEPSFIATPVAWDGYLDVAILKITKTFGGSLVEPSDLSDLTQVQLGDSSTVTSSEPIEFYGYPAATDSKTPTFTSGTVSSPVQDDRLNTNDAVWNSTAAIEHGNSGGLAVDAKTHKMIGIPTWVVLDETSGAPVYSRFRPINLVKPVLDAAEQGKTYTSPYAKPGPHSATATWVRADQSESGCTQIGGGGQSVTFDYSGFPGGSGQTDVAANLYVTEQGANGRQLELVGWADDDGANAYPTKLPSSGCIRFRFNIPSSPSAGSDGYTIKVGVGADLHVIYDDGGFHWG